MAFGEGCYASSSSRPRITALRHRPPHGLPLHCQADTVRCSLATVFSSR